MGCLRGGFGRALACLRAVTASAGLSQTERQCWLQGLMQGLMPYGHQGMPGMGAQALSLTHLCIRILALAHTWISSPASGKLAPPFTLPPHHDKHPLPHWLILCAGHGRWRCPSQQRPAAPPGFPTCTLTRTEAFMIALQCGGVVVV